MKKIINLLLLLCFASPLSVIAADGKGNGTDYLETLFAKAKLLASQNLDRIEVADIKNLPISKRNKKWLNKVHPDFDTNLEALQVYISSLSISFIAFGDGGCEDPESNKTHGICYYDDDPRVSKVIISKDRNKSLLAHLLGKENEFNNSNRNVGYTAAQINTSIQLAMAMLIHEAGHFAGESHHIKLDNLGAQIAAIPTLTNLTKLKKYSNAPLLDFITGGVRIDENSMSVSFDGLKIKGQPVYYSAEICQSLGLGKMLSYSQSATPTKTYWYLHNGMLKLSGGSNVNYGYDSVVCKILEK